MLKIEQPILDELAALLLERAGLKIAPDGYHGLKLALSTRMPVVGLADAEEYVRRLRQLAGENELRALLPLVTVGYTEFFRDMRQFRALEKQIIPAMLLQARRALRKIKIWSAGCATGEEAYSLAMVLNEQGAWSREVNFLATDLNLAAVESARAGRYPAKRFQGMPAARLRRFFCQTEEGYEVLPLLKEYVHFEGHNLAAPIFARIASASMDLILCRNVIIYFDLPTIQGLMDRFFTALRPGGFLLLGYSESLFKVYDKFEMVEVEGAFVYRRPEGKNAAGTLSQWRTVPVTSHTPAAGLPATPGSPAAASAPVKPLPVRASSGAEHRPPEQRLEDVAALMQKGNFDGALVAIKELLRDEPDDLDALLTLGNIYCLTGRSDESLEAFAQAVAHEPLCVEARVFGGVAGIQAGRLSEARAELGKALFLEPTLAIGHYLLAQVQEKLGEHENARRSYRNAITQLRFPQRRLAGHYPEMPESPDAIGLAARYALAALQEVS